MGHDTNLENTLLPISRAMGWSRITLKIIDIDRDRSSDLTFSSAVLAGEATSQPDKVTQLLILARSSGPLVAGS